jgi:hypothetical protein
MGGESGQLVPRVGCHEDCIAHSGQIIARIGVCDRRGCRDPLRGR